MEDIYFRNGVPSKTHYELELLSFMIVITMELIILFFPDG